MNGIVGTDLEDGYVLVLTVHLPMDTSVVVELLEVALRRYPHARVASAPPDQLRVVVGEEVAPPAECSDCHATLGTWVLVREHVCEVGG